MKALPIFAVLLLQSLAAAQDIPLEVKGETITVVKKLPFTVNAPASFDLYFWNVPAGVVAIKRGPTLEVTVAPKGTLTFSIELVRIKWEDKKLESKYGTVTLSVGDAPAPPPPPPPPGPTPTDKLGFVNLSLAEARKLPPDTLKFANELADNFEAVSAKLAATLTMSPEEANADLRARNQKTLDVPTRGIWRPWFVAWQALADQKLSTRDDYVEAYQETAAGLRAATK